MHAALGKPRLMGQVSNALGGIVTQTLENLQAFVPKSHVGPVLRRVTELVAEFSSSAYTTDTELSRFGWILKTRNQFTIKISAAVGLM